MAVRLFVGNLPYDVTEAELRAHFAAIGPLSYLSLATDRDTGKPRGFAFVEFSARADAEDAIRRLNNQAFKGRPLAVNEARPREGRRPTGRSPEAPRPPTAADPSTDAGRDFGPDAAPRRRRRPGSGPRLLSAARSAPCTSARPDRCVSAQETTTVTRRRCAAHTGRVTAQTPAEHDTV